MKRLAIDLIGNEAAVVAAGHEQKEANSPVALRFLLGKKPGHPHLTLANIGSSPRLAELVTWADEVVLALPLRYCFVRLANVDLGGLGLYGADFLDWQAKQLLPDDLGDFWYHFHALGESFDGQTRKYLFCGARRDLVDRLIGLLHQHGARKVVCESDTLGLYHALCMTGHTQGLSLACEVKPDGLAVVAAIDGDLCAVRFLLGSPKDLSEELRYYASSVCYADMKPSLLLAGDVSLAAGWQVDWADCVESELKNELSVSGSASLFVVPWGLSLVNLDHD